MYLGRGLPSQATWQAQERCVRAWPDRGLRGGTLVCHHAHGDGVRAHIHRGRYGPGRGGREGSHTCDSRTRGRAAGGYIADTSLPEECPAACRQCGVLADADRPCVHPLPTRRHADPARAISPWCERQRAWGTKAWILSRKTKRGEAQRWQAWPPCCSQEGLQEDGVHSRKHGLHLGFGRREGRSSRLRVAVSTESRSVI